MTLTPAQRKSAIALAITVAAMLLGSFAPDALTPLRDAVCPAPAQTSAAP